MESFEFILEGPAVSLKAKKTNAKRYQKWIKTVRAAARVRWPIDRKPITGTVIVTITNYYTLSPPDVDNIIKPILDGLSEVVYVDDGQVHKVISEKIDQSNMRIENPTALLAETLGKYTELLHVMITWETEE